MAANERSNRMKIVYVPEWEIFDYFVLGLRAKDNSQLTASIALPCFPPETLPPDARLVEIRHDWQRRAFAFLICHESFPEVPEGLIIPDLISSLSETLVTALVYKAPTTLRGYMAGDITDPDNPQPDVIAEGK